MGWRLCVRTFCLLTGTIAFCGVVVAVFYLGAFRSGGYQDLNSVLAYTAGMAGRSDAGARHSPVALPQMCGCCGALHSRPRSQFVVLVCILPQPPPLPHPLPVSSFANLFGVLATVTPTLGACVLNCQGCMGGGSTLHPSSSSSQTQSLVSGASSS